MPGTLPGLVRRANPQLDSPSVGVVVWVSHVQAISCAGPERGVGSIEEEREVFGGRRGWTMGQRLRAPESYGLLLWLIIASLFATAFSDSTVGEIIAVVLQGGSLIFALYTSRSRPVVLRAAIALLVASSIAPVIISSTSSSDAVQLAIGSSIRLTLSLAAMAAILRRATQHARVDGEILLAALCLYLLLGMLFSAGYGLVGAIQPGPFFAGLSDGTWVDRLYFSFTTMTTVGYGDLTAAGDAGRMLAITEALLGELYLVSVVALIVGNLGRTRRPRGPGATG